MGNLYSFFVDFCLLKFCLFFLVFDFPNPPVASGMILTLRINPDYSPFFFVRIPPLSLGKVGKKNNRFLDKGVRYSCPLSLKFSKNLRGGELRESLGGEGIQEIKVL